MSDNTLPGNQEPLTATGTVGVQNGLVTLSSGLIPAGAWYHPDNQDVMTTATMLIGQTVTVTYRLNGRQKVAIGIEAA